MECHDRPLGGRFAFVIAGTVFATPNAIDGCKGQAGVEVVVVDAEDREIRVTSNFVGNFYRDDPNVTFPIRAGLVVGDTVRFMNAPVEHGRCNRCHTRDGREGATGRIIDLVAP